MQLLRQYSLFVYFIMFLYHYVSSRRQRDEYSPDAVKHPRLESTLHPFISPPFFRAPPPHYPNQAVAGSSSSFYDRYHSSPHSYPHPQVPAVSERPNSLQNYAKDKVLYIHMDWSWYTKVMSTDLCAFK